MNNNEINVIQKLLIKYGKWVLTFITTTVAATVFVINFTQSVNSLEPRIKKLEEHVYEQEKVYATIHEEMISKAEKNYKEFEMMSLKLETSLSQISTDLQFIKQKLMEKSLR